MRCEHLRLTPQALRFHRFAVGKAGSRSPVMGVFPAQQKKEHRPARTARGNLPLPFHCAVFRFPRNREKVRLENSPSAE
jgi:hypothetical protein